MCYFLDVYLSKKAEKKQKRWKRNRVEKGGEKERERDYDPGQKV